MSVTQEEFEALRAEVAALSARVEKLQGEKKSAPVAVTGDEETDYSDAFGRDLTGRLRRGMAGSGSPYGLAVTHIVSQLTRTGSGGTAMSIVTLDKAGDLSSDEKLDGNIARTAALIADPLTLRIFRQFIVWSFEGRPMRGTAAELGAALGATPERVEAALHALVDNGTVRRGLDPGDSVFYQWDGNNHLVMTLLFRA